MRAPGGGKLESFSKLDCHIMTIGEGVVARIILSKISGSIDIFN